MNIRTTLWTRHDGRRQLTLQMGPTSLFLDFDEAPIAAEHLASQPGRYVNEYLDHSQLSLYADIDGWNLLSRALLITVRHAQARRIATAIRQAVAATPEAA